MKATTTSTGMKKVSAVSTTARMHRIARGSSKSVGQVKSSTSVGRPALRWKASLR